MYPIRTHGSIEEKEGVDTVYVPDYIQRLRNKNVKALLVQEKAPYPPSFTFRLEKDQHDLLKNRQAAFRHRAYYYGFFCVKTPFELPYILGKTVHIDVDKIPKFNKLEKRVKATLHPFYIFHNSSKNRGYHLVEILQQMKYCNRGLPDKFFGQLAEDLIMLIRNRIRFYLILHHKDLDILEMFFVRPETERRSDVERFWTSSKK